MGNNQSNQEQESTLSLTDAEEVAQQPTRYSLLVYYRDGANLFPLSGDRTLTVGRSLDADIRIAEATLSRRHFSVSVVEDRVLLEDLGSCNGVYVNGQRVTQAELRLGDEIAAGIARFRITGEGSGAAKLDLDSYDLFTHFVDSEIVRSRSFGRTVALVAISGAKGHDTHLSEWCSDVKSVLRPVDRLSVYGPNDIDVLLPEIPLSELQKLIEQMAWCRGQHAPPLLCGVATFPATARSAEELIQVAHVARGQATASEPVQYAPSHGTEVYSSVSPSEEKARGGLNVVRSPALAEVYAQAERLATATLPVLIIGETGTGKEVLSRHIHEQGPRSKKPMRCINCGALPRELLESILFGHERGAFTGAVQRAKGAFEEADGGTVLLDEIGELSPAAQAALLRFLETKVVHPIGSGREVKVDVRILAATHRDLEAMADDGQFRWDLLFRLNAVTLKLPPLRERLEEIVPLAKGFAVHASETQGLPVRRISDEAVGVLRAYRWPGNVRELRNVIERAVVIAQTDTIGITDLPDRLRAVTPGDRRRRGFRFDETTSVFQVQRGSEKGSSGEPKERSVERPDQFRGAVEEFERRLLLAALYAEQGNKSGAARLLKMPLRTLMNRINEFGIAFEDAVLFAKENGTDILDDSATFSFRERVVNQEKQLIRAALKETEGNRSEAARRLKMPLRSFMKKLSDYPELGDG